MKRVVLLGLMALLIVPSVFAKKEKKPQEVDSLGNPITSPEISTRLLPIAPTTGGTKGGEHSRAI